MEKSKNPVVKTLESQQLEIEVNKNSVSLQIQNRLPGQRESLREGKEERWRLLG